jgi:hypothetical protein
MSAHDACKNTLFTRGFVNRNLDELQHQEEVINVKIYLFYLLDNLWEKKETKDIREPEEIWVLLLLYIQWWIHTHCQTGQQTWVS